ncbi:MAG: hypothetical protein DI526_05325, partial [Caulobacter segnis]
MARPEAEFASGLGGGVFIDFAGLPMSSPSGAAPKLRSRAWFDNPDNIDMTALYLERYLNF